MLAYIVHQAKEIIARLLCVSGLLALVRFLRVKLMRRPRLIVLCYHRISDRKLLLSPFRTSPQKFENHLRSFGRLFDVVPLSAVPEIIEQRRLKRDTLVFTFDDGYADNYTHAVPILARCGIRASFFVASRPLLQRKPYWLDAVAHRLEEAVYNDKADDLLHTTLGDKKMRLLKQVNFAQRREIVNDFLRLLREAEPQLRAQFTREGENISEEQLDQDRRVATPQQLREMQEAGHEIGAHSVSHERLAALTLAECTAEIRDSIRELWAAGLQVRSFAYPFGKQHDIGQAAPAILRRTPVCVAVTTEERAVCFDDDLLLLPRAVIANQSAHLLLLRLEALAWKRGWRE